MKHKGVTICVLLALTLVLPLALVPAGNAQSVVVLDFEGLEDQEQILEYYNGGLGGDGSGPGPDYDITFGTEAKALIDSDNGGSGNFANEPSPDTIGFFSTGAEFVMNVPNGFTDGFSFHYAAQYAGVVTVYDGPDATGNVLTSAPLSDNVTDCDAGGDPTGVYACWDLVSLTFTGTARSVDFGGVGSSTGFDDITLGVEPPENQPPTADPNGPYQGTVDSPIAFDGTGSSDPDGDPLTYAWDFGDGNTGSGATPSNTYAAAGTYDVCLTVNDGELDSAQVCTSAVVEAPANQPPTADPNGPYQGAVDSPIAFDGTGSSDPDGDPLTYAWDFGDGSTGSGATPSNTYAAAGTYDVCLTVNDGELDSAQVCTSAVVEAPANQPPTADPNGPYQGAVDSPIAFDGTGSSDPDGDPLTYAWDFGDGNTGSGATPSNTYAAAGTYDVCLIVNDGEFDSAQVCTSAVVEAPVNQPPTADPNGPYQGAVDSPIAFDGTGSSDPDGDPLTYAWDFGDGNTGSGATPSNTYAAAGTYDVCLTVNDGELDSAQVCTSAVVEAPVTVTGFVTGGGWIYTEPGAYAPDPNLEGKANFGFVSKYKKGATTPAGNTQFQFRAAGLKFHSSGYSWLVVAGPDYAEFGGSGTINGEGDYKFKIWAGDGDPDTFRIKIWEDGGGVETVIYDNGSNQALGGGSIEVHTK